MAANENFKIRLATKDDTQQIMDHLKDFFYRDEPINYSINLIDSMKGYNCSEDLSVQSIKDGVSFVATDSFGQIIGLCLNSVKQRFEVTTEEPQVDNQKLKMIFKMFDYIDADADLFGKYPKIDEILSVCVISVSSAWRGKGVAQVMLLETLKLAKQLGIYLVCAVCTSYYSAMLLKKVGFESIYTMKYKDYVENGIPVFFPEHPHTEASLLIQML